MTRKYTKLCALGKKMEFYREKKRRDENLDQLTQLDAAKGIGISHSTYNNWIMGKKSPRLNQIDQIAKYFKCSRNDLLNMSFPDKELLDTFKVESWEDSAESGRRWSEKTGEKNGTTDDD